MKESRQNETAWQQVCRVLMKAKEVMCRIGAGMGHFFKILYSYAFRFRKIPLAVPVVITSVYLAAYCRARMPEIVGIGLQENGQYTATISRDLAVLGPMAITFFCLILMFCSRRPLYPWLISVFSLVLPILIMAMNMLFLPF